MTQPGYQAYDADAGYGGVPALPAENRPARRNVLGLISLIVGASISVLQLIIQIATTAVIAAGGPIQLASVIGLVIIGLLALVALGLGIAGLVRRGAAKAAAGAGTALGAAALFGVITASLTPFIYDAFY